MAWSVTYDKGTHQLLVYDLATDEVNVLVESVPPSGIRPTVLWGENGIVVASDGNSEEYQAVHLYAPDGELLRADLSNGQYFTSYFLATDAEGTEYLGRYRNYWHGDVVDLETGASYIPEGIEMYSLLAPDGLTISGAVELYDSLAHLPDGKAVRFTELDANLSDLTPSTMFGRRELAISPDGEAFAVFYLAQLIWRDGEVTEVPPEIPAADGTGVLWAPMRHRIRGQLYSPAG